MTETKRFSIQRIAYLILTAMVYAGVELFLIWKNRILPDGALCIGLVTGAFFALYLLMIFTNRTRGRMSYIGTNYQKVVFFTLGAGVMIILFALLPDFLMPFMLPALLFAAVYDELVTLSSCLFLTVIFAVTVPQNVGFLYADLLMISGGCILGSYQKENAESPPWPVAILTTAYETAITLVFYYLSVYDLTPYMFVLSLVNGILCGAAVAFLVPYLAKNAKEERHASVEMLLRDSYSLVKEMRQFSENEYQHARRVSRLSKKCAELIHVNADVAACAGMYYRLGRIKGEPEIDNAVKTATDRCFPPEVIQILSEYGGILKLPGTPESAIVHMIDAFISRLEALDTNEAATDWDQDMVIYRTLNEFAQTGFYDESGLSMNRFLEIRELLVREEDLLRLE